MKLVPKAISSSLGKKYLMAVTGLLLTGFVLAHMAGNLLVFAGPEALNAYAQALKKMPVLLWTARSGLLVLFLVHLYLGISLTLENKAARPVGYFYERNLRSSWASRHMLLTGLVLLAFVAYHLAHFTFGATDTARYQEGPDHVVKFEPPLNYMQLVEVKSDADKAYRPAYKSLDEIRKSDDRWIDTRHDVYNMVVNGFRKPIVTVLYIVAMIFLGIHLWHGGSSLLQSLGLNYPKIRPLVRWIGPALAVLVVVGNCSIPVWILINHP